jgi:hypothetical protein
MAKANLSDDGSVSDVTTGPENTRYGCRLLSWGHSEWVPSRSETGVREEVHPPRGLLPYQQTVGPSLFEPAGDFG